ncbi:phosphoribosylglycinamide formyltransferase [Moheibacter sediminis]|uniref:Phosphoribosylglycinamide formyltransferase n=1 Tax=Moheibacter sediminis TaxID=1434700 RepID=A0A1W2BQA5_9FLAO|nr:phosphoribosylglycinamide formyltransferase [Moheibacter sediminis]SMC75031.1 phosphoribosylglycinamide formyltransferase-1 [Moheibacter sediminis]
MKIAVFVSGGGTNLQNIIDAIQDGSLPNVEISMVIADRNCLAVERALDVDIPTYLLEDRKAFSEDAQHNLEGEEIDLIVLAGFLSILSKEFVEKWENKMINVHPALLPKYGGKGMYGKKVHEAVLANNEKESGATVHYVTAGIDEGEIILQQAFPIKPGENVDWLAWRISQVEKEILIEAIKKLAK